MSIEESKSARGNTGTPEAAPATPVESAKRPEELRRERVDDLRSEIATIKAQRSKSAANGPDREAKYDAAVLAVQNALGGNVSGESMRVIHERVVGDAAERERKAAERIDALELSVLHELLRTPEEERDIRQREGLWKNVNETAPDRSSIETFGVFHSRSAEEMRPAVEAIEQADPDIVLIEGDPLERSFPGLSREELAKLDPNEVIAQKGEQAYIALEALKRGKEVRSWDLRPMEQIRGVLATKEGEAGKYSPDEIAAWMATYASRGIYERQQGKPVTTEQIRKSIGVFLGPKDWAEATSLGIDLSDANIERLFEKHAGVSLKELAARFDDPETQREDRERLIEMTEPELVDKPRVTSDILRAMNIERDKHAMEVIRQAKKDKPGGKVFVTGGGSHVTTWAPALGELYKG